MPQTLPPMRRIVKGRAMIQQGTSIIQNTVAPAQAGAYLAFRDTRIDEIDPSLRWGDGLCGFEGMVS